MQKVRRQPFIPEDKHSPPTACRFIISGSISLPSRGSFQLSLTVLVHFRSDGVFSLSPWSGQIPARFPVPGSTWDTSRLLRNFAYLAFTVYGVFFQTLLLFHHNATLRSRNPDMQACRFSLFLFSLAATKGISFDFFSSGYLDVSIRLVSLPRLLCIQRQDTVV